ncbi:hypothetical protein [Mycobacterium sp.]|uniref:hypothetical protein n=1 Tax=Mycobacterium sp. TaxID=1785 RepID=UPI003F9AEFD6
MWSAPRRPTSAKAPGYDKLTVNEQSGVLTVHRIDGFEEVTTHYSPSAWASVTRRVKEAVVKRPLVGANKK